MHSSLPNHILTELRIVYRIIIETCKGLKQAGLMNIVIITTMAAILSIFGCMFRTSLGLSTFMNELGNVLEVSVYLKPDANADSVSRKIKDFQYVQRIKIIPKEEAWNELKKQMNVPNIKNPLPDTLHVKVSSQKFVDSTVKQIKQLNSVEDIQYAKELAKKMKNISDISHIATIIIMVLLGGLTMFIISNTIQLVIQSRKQEIEIMRLMGVSNWYIKAPYIIQGAFYGFCSAIIALIPIGILQTYLNQILTFFGMPAPAMATNIVILCLIVMGLTFGAGGSMISVKKYLKV